MDGVIYGSARARGADLDVGELLRDALDPVGSAGGHATMAGAQVPLGILQEVSESESLEDVVEAFVAGRFFEALDDAPRRRQARYRSFRESDGGSSPTPSVPLSRPPVLLVSRPQPLSLSRPPRPRAQPTYFATANQ